LQTVVAWQGGSSNSIKIRRRDKNMTEEEEEGVLGLWIMMSGYVKPDREVKLSFLTIIITII
jgi:hypothetical protein